MSALKHFIKNEIILTVSLVLAVISAFIIHPDFQYISYIDFRTLSILLSLMITMAGFQKLRLFRQIGEVLVAKSNSIRGVVLILISLNFFSSMVITNDVALLTFVPFSIVTLSLAKRQDLFILTIVLETIAANLGSMLTPLGNPQNLYLYSLSNMKLAQFIKLMLPFSIVAFIMLFINTVIKIKADAITAPASSPITRNHREKLQMVIFIIGFFVSLLVVARIVDYRLGLVIVLILTALSDYKILKKPDYTLLFTFIFLFIFIGNIKRIDIVSQLLKNVISDKEVIVSCILSQFISNVPSAILCSGFTDSIDKLIIGTNIGGLGTLIASMASLISFKQYSYIDGADKKSYVLSFTFWNIIFLIVMGMTAMVLD